MTFAKILKYNSCHDPATGKFCAGGQKHSSKEKLTAFMQEFWDTTAENPFNPRERITNELVGIEVYPFDGGIHLSFITSYEKKGRGSASKALGALEALADKHQVALNATVKAVPAAGAKNKKSLTNAQLHEWYGRHGFVKDKYGMIYRNPQISKGVA